MADLRQQCVAFFMAGISLFSLLAHLAIKPTSRLECLLVMKNEDPYMRVKSERQMVDGFPNAAEESMFWSKMYRKKILFIFLQFAVLTVWCFNIGRSCLVHLCTRETFRFNGLQIFVDLYLLAIIMLSIVEGQKYHGRALIYLWVLMTSKFSLMSAVSLLPSSGVSPTDFVFNKTMLDPWNIDLVCTFLAWLIIVFLPRGPKLYYPPEEVYSTKTIAACGKFPEENVSDENGASLYGTLFFTYVTDVFMLGKLNKTSTLNCLPILPANLRASVNMLMMEYARLHIKKRWLSQHSGFVLAHQLGWANLGDIVGLQIMSVIATVMFFVPALFIQFFLAYLEKDPQRVNISWGRLYVVGLFISNALLVLATAHQMSFSTNQLRTRLRLQLNTLLYAKTLVRKDAVSSTASLSNEIYPSANSGFSSKSEVMTLMTTDVGRAVDFSRLIMTPINATLGIAIGTYMLFNILGVSAFVGLAITIVLIPLNQLAGRFILNYQQSVMKCRDERTALTNEFLGGIRMIKSMAWERGFERRVLDVRNKELRLQRKIFILETIWNSLGNSIPLFFALGSFWHFAVMRREELTPAIAFTAIVVIGEIKYPMMELPEFLVASLQAFVSLQRIEKYLEIEEVETKELDTSQGPSEITLQSATICWPQPRHKNTDTSAPSTSRQPFLLNEVSASFPRGEISLICGRIGAGKSLLLLGLLGEADLVGGSIKCPHSNPDSYSILSHQPSDENWVLEDICAYVPQTSWLRNATIKENILFNLPYNAGRYETVLEVCALMPDLNVLEHGDESEIGEQGISLSGGQKARVSLARAVYSRASILLLDDVLSALDFHTAQHIWDRCFRGDLMRGRTVLLVSHHIQLCGPNAKLILALGNGHVEFCGDWESFQGSRAMEAILASSPEGSNDEAEKVLLETTMQSPGPSQANGIAPILTTEQSTFPTKQPQKQAKQETRFEGRISKEVWLLYAKSAGSYWYWAFLLIIMMMGALSPLWENGWLKIWSSGENTSRRAVFYISVYTSIVALEIVVKIIRWLALYHGSINASHKLYEKLLEAVLFANIRFHDTISRGWLLNRFGRDFEVVDNDLPNQLGWTLLVGAGLIVTIVSLVVVGGWPFLLASIGVVAIIYFVSRIFGQVARDLKRLSSTTNSPLFSIYGETISGLAVIRAFGMSTKFLDDMIVCLDTNMNPTYWSGGLHRWLTVRFQMASGSLLSLMAMVILMNPSIDASWAGLALAFASTLSLDMYWFVRRLADSEQIMVSLERIKEYSDLPSQAPEFIEPRPPAAWPTSGSLCFENVFVKYAPELPDVLHDLSFEIKPGEKIGIIGRTGSGKSTIALTIMRFVEAREGTISIDGLDISKIGLTDLRRRLTVVPQDPILLSGTLRSTLDVFGDYDDAEIFEALRRVNLIRSDGMVTEPEPGKEASDETRHDSVFSNLDTPVFELGDNFSTGEKQLLCMARALLRRSKILIMDEATASVDHATDEIISQTVRSEFADSTIITIAHRLRTVIDYDKIMVMDEGRIVEFDRPAVLISDETFLFYGLCKASGTEEFSRLRAMAMV